MLINQKGKKCSPLRRLKRVYSGRGRHGKHLHRGFGAVHWPGSMHDCRAKSTIIGIQMCCLHKSTLNPGRSASILVFSSTVPRQVNVRLSPVDLHQAQYLSGIRHGQLNSPAIALYLRRNHVRSVFGYTYRYCISQYATQAMSNVGIAAATDASLEPCLFVPSERGRWRLASPLIREISALNFQSSEQVSIWQSTVTSSDLASLNGLGHSSPHAEQRADHNWISGSGLITSINRDQGCSAGPPMRDAGQIASTNQKLSVFQKKKLSLSLFRSLTNANTYFDITYRRLQSEQSRM